MLRRSTIAGVIAVGSLAGCAVGPNFHAPAPPTATQYTRGQQPQQTAAAPVAAGGAAQTLVPDRDIPSDWYSLFQSEPLDDLVRKALHDSPTVEAAKAALRSAENSYLAERGALAACPQVDGQLGVTRERAPGATFGDAAAPPSLFTLHSASVNVSYRLDLFGALPQAGGGVAGAGRFATLGAGSGESDADGSVVTTAFEWPRCAIN